MRQATILILVLIGCATDDDLTEEDGPEEDVSTLAPQHDSTDCPGPGRGGGGADPNPIPAPRDCTAEVTHEACYQCCEWNADKVWEERCRRIPRRDKSERARCWADAADRRGTCYKMCPSPILTLTLEANQ